jgi:hypothetical protein
MTQAVMNNQIPDSMSAIVIFAAAPAGYGQGHFAEVQHIYVDSQVALRPAVELVPANELLVPPPGITLPPAVPVAPPPGRLLAPAPDAGLPSLLPLPPQADPKAAAPASSTATAQKPDFEEYRMGSTDHLAEHSSQCMEWILTCI